MDTAEACGRCFGSSIANRRAFTEPWSRTPTGLVVPRQACDPNGQEVVARQVSSNLDPSLTADR